MDLEEQILRYYLKVFSILSIISVLFSLFLIYVLNKNIILNNEILSISKGEKFEKILNDNVQNLSKTELFIINKYYQINYILFNNFIHYGDFYIGFNTSSIKLIKIITKASNVLNKITIVEGWSQKELFKELSKHFKDYEIIPFHHIIADTYYYEKNKDFNFFLNDLKNNKNSYFEKYKKNEISKLFSEIDIITIGSLIEKEGLDINDKRKISSVIFNRLNKKMKLQIDATVLFAMTNGEFNLNRKLLISDLKYEHPYNTYNYYGLPPGPISYVGRKTIDIIFENYKSDFLFYFFNKSLNRHIFSKNYEEHIKKLNEYRNNQ